MTDQVDKTTEDWGEISTEEARIMVRGLLCLGGGGSSGGPSVTVYGPAYFEPTLRVVISSGGEECWYVRK